MRKDDCALDSKTLLFSTTKYIGRELQLWSNEPPTHQSVKNSEMNSEISLTAIDFIRAIATVIMTATDPSCWNAEAGCFTAKLVARTCYSTKHMH